MPYRKIKNVIASFFARRLTPEVKELYSSTLILNFAFAMVAIFEPVFLYVLYIKNHSLNETLQLILWFYLVIYLIYFALLPLGAKFARRFGYEHSIALSTVAVSLFYLCLFGATNWFWLIWPAAIFDALWRTFYWPAYHSDFARFSAKGEQGRQISNLVALECLVYIVGPIIGGFILETYGFGALFIVVIVLLLASNIPILITREKFTPVPFSYFEAYQRLFRRENRRRFLANVGFGEELIALVIWPVFIYVVVNDFLGLGFLSAMSLLVTTIIFLFIGRAVDKKDRRLVLKIGTIFYFLSWLVRLIARGVFGVFIVDVHSRVAKQATSIPITASIYQKAQNGSVMTTITFFEMSLIVGKIMVIAGSLVLLQFFAPGWNVMFILSGLFTLLYLLF